MLYITEQAALKLVNAVDAHEFEHLHSEHRLRFPFFASVKIMRRPSKLSAAQPGDNENSFDCFIVDAGEQGMHEALSLRSSVLLPMVSPSVDNVLPAKLSMIEKSEHYAMAVRYMTQEVPEELSKAASKANAGVAFIRACTRVVALVCSSQRSKVLDAGKSGHKLVTENVIDIFQPDGDGEQTHYNLISFCTLDNVTDYKMDPPRGQKTQAALVNVTGVIDADIDSAEPHVKYLLVDDVQLVTPAEADGLKSVLSKMFYYAALGGQISRKREAESWSSDDNPARTSMCRTLGRSPTGPPVPDYLP